MAEAAKILIYIYAYHRRARPQHPADLPQRRAGPGEVVEGVGAEDSIERTIIDRPEFG
jgi:hypothetical protein